jgi:exopolysaccharide biosynthesis WecB/TagA/CpsF family protein
MTTRPAYVLGKPDERRIAAALPLVGGRVSDNVSTIPATNSERVMGPVTLQVADRAEAVARVRDAITARAGGVFGFCNMHTYNLALRSPPFADALSHITVFNDGLGIDIASWLMFGKAFPANLNGTDFLPDLFAALDSPRRVYLLGAAPGVAEEAGAKITERFPHIVIAGTHHGFFTPDEREQVLKNVAAARADIVLIGMGNPRQELLAVSAADRIDAVQICVGAFLDFTAGRIPRAPRLVRMLRAEWIYRLVLEPRRLAPRYLGGALPFLRSVLRERRNRVR